MIDPRPMTHETRLNRFWNELVRPTGDPDAGGGLDPAAADAVRRLQTLGAAPPPASSRERVRRAVQANVRSRPTRGGETPMNQAARFAPTRPIAGSNGRPVALPLGRPLVVVPPVSRGRRHWGGAQLATAALLLLTLGLGYLALGPGHADPDRSTMLPAAVGPAGTPAPDRAAAETLLRVTLPTTLVPQNGGGNSGLGRFTVPPGTRGTWTASAYGCCGGVRVDYVVAGRYTVWAEGPVQVVPAGGTPETVLAGTARVLGPGDAMIAPNETGFTATNPGPAPAVVLAWNRLTGIGPDAQVPTGWLDETHDVQPNVALPPGPATLVLRRVELAPDATFPAPAAGTLQFGVPLPDNAAGTPVAAYPIVHRGDGAIHNVGRAAVTLCVLTLEPAKGEAGTPVAGVPTP